MQEIRNEELKNTDILTLKPNSLFYKNGFFFQAQAEYSYFSANFISKIFLLLFLTYIV